VLSDDDKAGLGVAFNEARWLSVAVDVARRSAVVTLAPLTLPPSGPPPDDRRILIVLEPVGRVRVRRVSAGGEVLPVPLAELSAVVESFGGLPIYGWEFIDTEIPPLTPAELSADAVLGSDGHTHTLHVFQDAVHLGLDLWLWFDVLECRTLGGEVLPLADVIAGGKRWWDGLFSGDPRTAGTGIVPLKGDGS
jgi:hypothetical protein